MSSFYCWSCVQYHEHTREQTYKVQERIQQVEKEAELFGYKIAAYEALAKWNSKND